MTSLPSAIIAPSGPTLEISDIYTLLMARFLYRLIDGSSGPNRLKKAICCMIFIAWDSKIITPQASKIFFIISNSSPFRVHDKSRPSIFIRRFFWIGITYTIPFLLSFNMIKAGYYRAFSRGYLIAYYGAYEDPALHAS